MNSSTACPVSPTISIILPTYNRAPFLAEALEAIHQQTFKDWELIIVDDGSNDNTHQVVNDVTREWSQLVRFQRQENKGAYGARNTGLDLAVGRYVAFFDSDDLWLPFHLGDCVKELESHNLDWIFSACRRVEAASRRVMLQNTFYHSDGTPWPFLRLNSRVDGLLHIIDDRRALECHLAAGLNCGLQASVIRRNFFKGYRFQTAYWNEAEDQMTVIVALAQKSRMAYLDKVHVEYRVHGGNSSATEGTDVDKRIAVIKAETRGLEETRTRGIVLSRDESRALRRRLFGQYFWQLGYTLLWQNGRRREALVMFRRGLRLWPWELRAWKTYLCLQTRSIMFSSLLGLKIFSF